jgi:hypothetical protein
MSIKRGFILQFVNREKYDPVVTDENRERFDAVELALCDRPLTVGRVVALVEEIKALYGAFDTDFRVLFTVVRGISTQVLARASYIEFLDLQEFKPMENKNNWSLKDLEKFITGYDRDILELEHKVSLITLRKREAMLAYCSRVSAGFRVRAFDLTKGYPTFRPGMFISLLKGGKAYYLILSAKNITDVQDTVVGDPAKVNEVFSNAWKTLAAASIIGESVELNGVKTPISVSRDVLEMDADSLEFLYGLLKGPGPDVFFLENNN